MEKPDLMAVARVTMFVGWPPDRSTFASADAWVLYTGDGWGLPLFLAKQYAHFGTRRTRVLVVGPDNLMIQERDGQVNAEDFKKFLITNAVPARAITADASAATQYTHGQAAVLAQYAREHNWKRVVLFTSRHHALRAYLATVKALIDAGLDRTVAIYVAPSDALGFAERDPDTFAGKFRDMSTWQFFTLDGLPKIPIYQAKPEEERKMATWEEADAYMQWSIAQLN